MAKRIEAARESPPLEPRLGGFKIQGPVRGAPAAKNNDGLWHCTTGFKLEFKKTHLKSKNST